MPDMPTCLFLFAFFSVAGWGLEFFYRTMRAGKPVNPGFLRGPYLPLYGSAAVVLSICIAHMQGMGLLAKILIYFLVTTGGELLTGLIFNHLLKKQLWDYTDEAWCIGDCVCLKYSCYWVILAFFFEYALLPGALAVHALLAPAWAYAISTVLTGLISIDFLWNFTLSIRGLAKQPSSGRKDAIVDSAEFNQILQPLLQMQEVQHLADFKHHSHKNRLEHSLEVAWHGYALSRKYSLDYTAAARAGLLHDLFFYDWLREGPRLHGFRHPRISLENAQKITELNSKEVDIIKKHMWPLTLMPPRYPESWIICMADTYCSIKDYVVMRRNPNEC